MALQRKKTSATSQCIIQDILLLASIVAACFNGPAAHFFKIIRWGLDHFINSKG